MGRASRRRQQKIAGTLEPKKVATYNFTEEQLKAKINEEMRAYKESTTNAVISRTVNSFIILIADILHSRFGYGETRLKRFFFDFYKLCDELAFDEPEDGEEAIDILKIKQGLIDEGIDIEGLLWNRITDKEVRSKEVDSDVPKNVRDSLAYKKKTLDTLFLDIGKQCEASVVGEVILVSDGKKNYANADAYRFVFSEFNIGNLENKLLLADLLKHGAEYGVTL